MKKVACIPRLASRSFTAGYCVAWPSSNVNDTIVRGSGSEVVTSTVQVRVAGEPSTFPAASDARTAKVCVPFARPEYDFGDAHGAHRPRPGCTRRSRARSS